MGWNLAGIQPQVQSSRSEGGTTGAKLLVGGHEGRHQVVIPPIGRVAEKKMVYFFIINPSSTLLALECLVLILIHAK